MDLMTNIYIWIGGTFTFAIIALMLFAVILFLSIKTHATMELKAFIKKRPIGLFFQDNRYCEWKVVKDEAGIITDKKYGSFIINEKGSYVDRQTKAILLPFDANIGTSVNIKACKVSEDLKMLLRNETEVLALRKAIATNQIGDEEICGLKSSINLGAIKSMLNAMLPHNITAKVNMMVAQKLNNVNKVNYWEIILIFVSVLGAIVMGYILIKQVA